MSDRSMWFNRMTFRRREVTGLDPDTRTPRYSVVTVLQAEPCDFILRARRKAQQGPNGTVWNTVKVPTVKIYPLRGILDVPDENDMVLVDDVSYRVDQVENFFDAGDNRYMGSRLTLESAEAT